MFGRLVRRLLLANRGRLLVILLALSAGAAVSAALLNLQTDAKRRLTTEFRSFGPNVLITPGPGQSEARDGATLDDSIARAFPSKPFGTNFTGLPFLFLAARVESVDSSRGTQAIVVGTDLRSFGFREPGWNIGDTMTAHYTENDCLVGVHLARSLQVAAGSSLRMKDGVRIETCQIRRILSTGGPEDNQAVLSLKRAQRLAGAEGRISLVEVFVSGDPTEVKQTATYLRKRYPDLEVRPLREFSEAQAKVYAHISGLLTAATALILILTGLCVMAAMTNMAAERKHDVGMMKAIGGSARGILSLFLTEAALLGLAGGLMGAAAGMALSIALGKAVFGIAAAPRLIVYPISVTLTVMVSILGAYPLRRLASVRPATIFRGDA